MHPSTTRAEALASRAAGVFALAYGLFGYLFFFASFGLYWVAFLADRWVPITVNQRPGEAAPLGLAVAVDLALVLLFGLQHSVMARPAFKRWWTRTVPPALERSTYVLLASFFLTLLMLLWQPIPGVVWQFDSPAGQAVLWTLFALGIPLCVVASFQIDHFDLLGLRQVWLQFRGRPYTPPEFTEPWLYRVVRHPIQLGVLLLLWPLPTMTVGHLLLASAMTIYILIGLYFEERDLVAEFGERYRAYRRRVPGLIPLPVGRIVPKSLRSRLRFRLGLFAFVSITVLALSALLLLAADVASASGSESGAALSTPVSPGSADRLAPVESGCPTFSWTSAPGAEGYEIAVYEVTAEPSLDIGTDPVLHRHLPAGANSWTPAADRCLDPGGRYAWSIRPLLSDDSSAWSEPLLLAVAAGPTAPRVQHDEDAPRPRRSSPASVDKPVKRSRNGGARGTADGGGAPAPRGGDGSTPRAAASPLVILPAPDLVVQGSIQTASDFIYSETKLLRVWVPAVSFAPSIPTEDDVWRVSTEGYGFISSIPDSVASVDLIAVVPRLPDGATVTFFDCQYGDLSATDDLTLTFRLRRRLTSQSTATVMAEVSTTSVSNSSGPRGAFDGSIEDPDTNPSSASYYIEGTFAPDVIGNDLRFYGCSLDLETRTVRP